MENCDGGSLKDYIKHKGPLTEEKTRKLTK